MPTFSAITLDRLLEPGTSKSMAAGKTAVDPKLERRNSIPSSKLERGVGVSNSKQERANSTSSMILDKRHHWVRISPVLYATPEPTPLPDSPTSFSPSPYIVNHKRRGPHLLKSFNEDDVATREQALDEEKVAVDANRTETEVVHSDKDTSSLLPVPSLVGEANSNGVYDIQLGSSEPSGGLAGENGSFKPVTPNVEKDDEVEDFLDLQDSMSVKSSIQGDSNGVAERPLNLTTPMAEFYDAWEELSSENGPQPPLVDVEAELREMRLSLLMEIDKRKQTEEDLDNLRSCWLKIRQQLSLVGLTLPADPIDGAEDEQLGDPTEQLCQQVYIARFVSNSIGRGIAKAEVEVEMEAQIQSKNFEIARLCDRLHYYETVNREMSQRNQEVVETARRLWQSKKRRQRWIWGSIIAAITFGSAALAWSYLPSGKGSSSANTSNAPEGNDLSR
ncbi:hypothetical protein RJ639_034463 [Escallonia herrerae]|uniref:Netrin receptor DCC n=1 Tax=Escallonia herrerae TaxID=1293975 RepID=A0AA89BJQ0_9ASTE|nr:hypothetical protein RJ639_034463 [Escallonia herrerae]